MADEAREAFLEALVLWTWKDHVHGQDVVDAACTALVAGLDSPALRDLAGLYPDTPQDVLRLAVEDVVAELRITLPVGDDALSRFVLRQQARALLDGRITPRALTEWAYSTGSMRGSEGYSRLVGALWEYEEIDDLAEYLGRGTPTHPEATATLDTHVRRMARALLAEP